MQVDLSAQSLNIDHYPYSDVLKSIGKCDTMFICRVKYPYRSNHSVREQAVFVYSREGIWYTNVMKQYCKKRRFHGIRKYVWDLYAPVCIASSGKLISESFYELKNNIMKTYWAEDSFYLSIKTGSDTIERRLQGDEECFKQQTPVAYSIFTANIPNAKKIQKKYSEIVKPHLIN